MTPNEKHPVWRRLNVGLCVYVCDKDMTVVPWDVKGGRQPNGRSESG